MTLPGQAMTEGIGLGRVTRAAVFSVLLLLAVGGLSCAGETASPGLDETRPPRRVSARFSWLLRAYNLPLVVAKDRGFYGSRGIEVEVNEGKGDSITCELISNRQETFAMADAFTGALSISKGAHLRFVSMFVQNNPSSIIFAPHQGIQRPEDLKGKRGGISPAGAATVLLKAVLAQYEIGEDEVQLTAMAPSAKKAALLGGKVDFINGFINGDYQSVRLEDPTLQAVPYYSWDVNALNMGLITHPDTIRDDPQLVRDFVAATTEGWHYMMDHPQEAAAIGVRHFPLADRAVLEQGIQATLSLLHTPHSQGRPLGWTAESDWRSTIELVGRYTGSEPVEDLEQYYTNEFVAPE